MAPASDGRSRDKSQVRSGGRGASQHAAYQNIKCSPGRRVSWPAIIVTPILWRFGQGELLRCNVYVNLSTSECWAADAMLMVKG